LAEDHGLSPEDMFTIGLLHDLGHLVTAGYMPEDFAKVVEIRDTKTIAMADAEMLQFGLDHGVIGAMVLASWDLPPTITEPINWHHAPDKAPGFIKEAALLCVSDALARKFEDPDYLVRDNWQELVQDLGVEVEAVSTLLAELAENEATKQLLTTLSA
jgi:HD-like signal output (HDOD) protein